MDDLDDLEDLEAATAEEEEEDELDFELGPSNDEPGPQATSSAPHRQNARPSQQPVSEESSSTEPSGPAFTPDGLEEIVTKNGDGQEVSNFTPEQAAEAGTLNAGVHYRTGGFISALGLVNKMFREHEVGIIMNKGPGWKQLLS